MMILFFLFILAEMTALFTGLGWQLNQSLDSTRTNWLIIGGGIGCGIMLGLIAGWLAMQTVNRAPRVLYLWGGGILGAALGWAVGNSILHLPPQQILLAGVAGSVLAGILVLVAGTLIHNSLGQKGAPQANPSSYAPVMHQQMPPPRYQEPLQNPEIELKRLRKRLYQEANNLVQNPTLVSQSVAGTRWPEPQLFIVDPAHMALVVVIPCYLGRLTFFIVCPTGYPELPPVEVHMELARPDGSPPVEINYDGRRLSNWQARSNLANVLKDGFLQIEQTVLG